MADETTLQESAGNTSSDRAFSGEVKVDGEDLRAREECFCAVMDILLAGMEKADKVSKEAAKHLLLAMEMEIDTSVSLLVYNAYVREYNALREKCFLSVAADLRSKTIKFSRDIMESFEQKTKTMRIHLSPALPKSAGIRM